MNNVHDVAKLCLLISVIDIQDDVRLIDAFLLTEFLIAIII